MTVPLSLVVLALLLVGCGGRLLTPLPDDETAVQTWVISHDSMYVVYSTVTQVKGEHEDPWKLPQTWFSVPIAGSAEPIPLFDGKSIHEIHNWKISDDSKYMMLLGDIDTPNEHELFRSAIAGGPMEKLSGAIPAGGSVHSFALTKDTKTVILHGDMETDTVNELFSVSLANPGVRTKISGNIVDQGQVNAYPYGINNERWYQPFRVTPDSKHVLFTGTLDHLDNIDLYSVNLATNVRTKFMPGPLAASSRRVYYSFVITSDSKRVIFYAGVEGGDFDLYSAPVEGGQAWTKFNVPGEIMYPSLTPDGMSIVSQVTTHVGFEQKNDYWFATGMATGEYQVFDRIDPKDNFWVEVTPDSQTVIAHDSRYIPRRRNSYNYHLVAVKYKKLGFASNEEHLLLPADTNFRSINSHVAPDSKSMVFVANHSLWDVPIAPDAQYRLLLEPHKDGKIDYLNFVPGASDRVVLTGFLTAPYFDRFLYHYTIGGSLDRLPATIPAPDGGAYNSYKMSEDGKWAVIQGDLLKKRQIQLFVESLPPPPEPPTAAPPTGSSPQNDTALKAVVVVLVLAVIGLVAGILVVRFRKKASDKKATADIFGGDAGGDTYLDGLSVVE